MAGVLSFEDCSDCAVVDCALYGSGSVGLEISGSNGIAMRGGAIRDCSVGAAWIDGAWDVGLQGVEVAGNSGGYPLLRVEASNAVTFSGCRFLGNAGETFIGVGPATEACGFEFCEFFDNDFGALSGGELGAYFFEAGYEGNSFDLDLDAVAEWGGDGEAVFQPLEPPGSGLALECPPWFAVDLSDPDRPLLHEGDPAAAGIVIGAVRVLRDGDDPDTQAERILRAALPAAEAWLAAAGVVVARRSAEEPVNTEAPPYYLEYYAEGRSGSLPVALRVKLVQGSGAVWCFAAYHADPELVRPQSAYGAALDSIGAAAEGR